MKKILTLVACLSLVASLAVGGSIAYLQSTDSAVNVMTLGNVKIDQIEQERNADGNLVDFTQGKPAYPAVNASNQGGGENWGKIEVNGKEYMMSNVINGIDKIVTVNNTGKSDAYVRTIVAIEAPEGDPDNLIMVTWNQDVWENIGGNDSGIKIANDFVTEIDGVTYYVAEILYTEALAAGAKSAPSLLQVYLTSETTNEDCAKFGETWEILVLSQAVQTAGFEEVGAAAALNEAFGEVTANKAVEWFTGMKAPSIASNVEETKDLLEQGGNILLSDDITTTAEDVEDGKKAYFFTEAEDETVIDLNGKTLTAADRTNAVFRTDNSKLTIRGNGTVEFGYALAIVQGEKSQLIIESGTFLRDDASNNDTDNTAFVKSLNLGTDAVIIKGGYFDLGVKDKGGYSDAMEYPFWPSDITTANATIYGGQFVNWNPTDSGYLAEGAVVTSEVVEGKTIYTVTTK